MRFLRKLLLWLIGSVVGLIVLAYITGNEHLVRGMRYTYLIGRNSPEIDDRDFFPYSTIPADDPQPWPQGERYGKLALTAEEEQELKDLYSVGFAVFQHDSIIFEQYWNGWDADSVSNSFSVAKSYISLLTGVAMKEGVINNIFQPVGDFIPQYKEGCYAKLNLYHVQTMSTGLDWSESGANPFSDNAKGYYGSNVRELSLNQPCRDEPGKEFDYISGSTQIMAEVLESAYGQPLDELVREKIWGPLGCEHEAYWGKDTKDGDFKAFCCLYATARDFGRIGQLYLDSGVWKGEQLIDREYWKASITPADLNDKGTPNKRYGYFWWLAEVDGQPVWYCRGFHGEYVVVLPQEDLVFVRTGMKREEVNDTGHPTDVFKWIAIARKMAARPT
ncbi:MAG: serine hydrolase [Flavobacteriales bacterium]|jgi:CubicO group peptidase (beta-lactamase class C family)|nr:serine hydrolase [Flavobacteriales bacterium]MBK7102840.1 serine hydrolase [Flavobacteriales bacterium]MBK7113555.1 serine hydrolase [Flavobacteriales bacterium]MBK7619785.1 serine hydrolase [Flavobacteriales bacterium]MBK8710112.1 serine hydrolase [Flavobacteriales bacterium]